MNELINYVNSSFDEVNSMILPVIKFSFIMALFVFSLILLLGILSHICYDIFRFFRYLPIRKYIRKANDINYLLSDEFNNELKSLSFKKLKLLCKYFNLDIDDYMK